MQIVSKIIEAHLFRLSGNDIEFLLLKRSDDDNLYPGLWQMVSGSIHENEKAFVTALREIKEETGLLPKKFWTVPHINSFYEPQKDELHLVPVFAAQISNGDNVELSHEHSAYKWVNSDEAIEMLAWKGQKESVKTIVDYFTSRLSTLNLLEINLPGSIK